MKKIVIGADHAGYEYKEYIREYLQMNGYTVTDKGTFSKDSVDYPDFAHAVAEVIENNQADFGILFCGSANGVAIAANKHKGVRAAICWEKEISQLARQHNNANIICIPARFVAKELAQEMIDTFFATTFEGGRHQNRVAKIDC
ncbi:MAG TPA: ribose 5-phosphate isomerase B [Bacteroidia bacterium]|nr:ribose 5-phosphate isomerase B [Bacteroidia bacterium]HNU33225.1 ribose 5-phosphate isomerase B [Bacteroidia bacterium]